MEDIKKEYLPKYSKIMTEQVLSLLSKIKNRNKNFPENIKKEKMKELWDSEKDEIWEDLFILNQHQLL